jgi:NAD(P)-dependent dehydrogenase (short-subunit alcohol dehydrogenase family)
MDRLDGRIAVITGTADGIGRGIALACADAGMKPVLADLDTDRLAATVAELDGAEVLAVPTDVRRAEQVEALASVAAAAFGTAHLVFDNAGVGTLGYQWETDRPGPDLDLRPGEPASRGVRPPALPPGVGRLSDHARSRAAGMPAEEGGRAGGRIILAGVRAGRFWILPATDGQLPPLQEQKDELISAFDPD